MKDMGDVVSYLNDILGPHHDFTIIARQQYESSNDQSKATRKYNDAEQCILWALSGLIFDLKEIDFRWTTDQMRVLVKEFALDDCGMEEVVCECLDAAEDYIADPTLMSMLEQDIDNILKDQAHLSKLMETVQRDLASDCIRVWFGE